MKRKTFNRRMVLKMLRIEFRLSIEQAAALLDRQTPQDREALYTRARATSACWPKTINNDTGPSMTSLHARPYWDDELFRRTAERVRGAQRQNGEKVRSLLAEATWLHLALLARGVA